MEYIESFYEPQFKDEFTLAINIKATSASAVFMSNHCIFFKDAKKPADLLVNMANLNVIWG